MPLGASITFGTGSSTGNGYRSYLRDLLRGEGYTVDLVGSQQNGDMDDRDNEGYPGLRIEEVYGKAQGTVPDRQPNLITINAGTNDCSQNFNLDTIGDRMGELLEYLWTTVPGTTIILSTLLINLNEETGARVIDANAKIGALTYQKQQEGKKLILVDMHSDAAPQPEDMYDDTHPNDVGFGKMATIWHQGIQDAQSRGWIV